MPSCVVHKICETPNESCLTNRSGAALQKEVFEYAQQLSGGRALMPASRPGVWNIRLDDGTNINVRTVSSSQVGRWTVEITNLSELNALGYSRSGRYEVRFK